jgi:putative ABC transport system substrate-binding protein
MLRLRSAQVLDNWIGRTDRDRDSDWEEIMNKKIALIVLPVFVLALAQPAEAQTKGKIPRVGVLEPGFSTQSICKDGFRQGLSELGYVERQTILLEYRYAESKADRLPDLAVELVKLKPDVIWTHSPPSVLTAKRATMTIPIVVGVARDLVEQGIVSSLARPGGNITGMELRDSEIIGKRLELLKQTLPKASRVAVLVNPKDPSHAHVPGNIEQEARALRVQLQRVEASGPEAFEKAFETIVQWRADALMLPESAMLSENRHRIFELATSKRLPTASGGPHFAEAGSLISYGANVIDICRRSAVFVDKILKGSKPANYRSSGPRSSRWLSILKRRKP